MGALSNSLRQTHEIGLQTITCPNGEEFSAFSVEDYAHCVNCQRDLRGGEDVYSCKCQPNGHAICKSCRTWGLRLPRHLRTTPEGEGFEHVWSASGRDMWLLEWR